MRIIRLQIKGFKGIVEADLPLGDVNVVAGQNGSGKSSVLDAISVAMTGAGALPALPVREGEANAEIIAYLEGGLTVRRRVTPDRRMALVVERQDGTRPPKAQEFLDGLCGSGLAFDPQEFLRSKPVVQGDTLRRLVGLDTSDLDAKRSSVYAERTAVGRQRDTAKGAADSLAFHEGVPESEVSAGELSGALMQANEAANERAELLRRADWALRMKKQHIAKSNDLNAELANLPAAKAAALEQVDRDFDVQEAEIRESIAALQRKLEGMQTKRIEVKDQTAQGFEADAAERRSALDVAISAAEEQESVEVALRLEANKVNVPDADALKQQIADVDAVNRKVRDNRRKNEAIAAWRGLADQYRELTEKIESIDAAKVSRLQSIQWPVDGLGLGEDGTVTFRGRPLEQASQAEQLRTAMAIGLHTAGEVKIILLREASLMDENSRKMVCDLAKSAGAQIVLEIVGAPDDTDGNCFVMMEGQVIYAQTFGN